MQTRTGSWAARPDSRLIIVLSSERSGSTLLRVMLGAHSRMVAPQELFLLRYPDFATWRARKPMAIESLVELFTLLGTPRTESAIDAACRGRTTVDVCRWLFDALRPGAFLIDKTPAYANDLSTLARTAALAPFYIWLIRHPLGVIDSHVRLKDKERRRRPLTRRVLHPLQDAVERWTDGLTAIGRRREAKWVTQNRNIHTFLREVPAEQQVHAYFEDLVRTPETVIQAVCAAIGIEPEPQMVRPETRQVMNPNLGDPNFHLHSGIDAHPAEGWTARYSEALLQPETLQLMKQIGVRAGGTRHRAA